MLPRARSPTPTRLLENDVLESLRKLNEKLDKTNEQQEELRRSVHQMKAKPARSVQFQTESNGKFCTIHKYGNHSTEECQVRRNANAGYCFKCGEPGHKAFECPTGRPQQQGYPPQNWRQHQPINRPQPPVGVNSASEEVLNG